METFVILSLFTTCLYMTDKTNRCNNFKKTHFKKNIEHFNHQSHLNQNGGADIKQIFYRVAPSQIHKGGVGVIAIADIPKGTVIFNDRTPTPGNFFKEEQLSHLNPDFIKIMKDYWCQSKKGEVFIPSNPENISFVSFLNHSDKPNVKPYNTYSYITTKDIKKGEELLEDYNEVCGTHFFTN